MEQGGGKQKSFDPKMGSLGSWKDDPIGDCCRLGSAAEEGGRQETRATMRLENIRTVGERGGGGGAE